MSENFVKSWVIAFALYFDMIIVVYCPSKRIAFVFVCLWLSGSSYIQLILCKSLDNNVFS